MYALSRLVRFAALAVLLSCLTIPAPARAQQEAVAIGGQIGTLGLQGSVAFNLNEYLDVRMAVGAMPSWSFNVDVNDLKYDFDMSIYTLGGFLDWHPMAGGFRLSGGVILNNHDINSSVTPASDKSWDIGGTSYPGWVLGTLDAKADFNTVAPYVGLGYCGAFRNTGRLHFTFDLGVMFWGSPNVSLSANNAIPVPGLQESLRKEEEELEDQLNFLQYYPVAAIGVSWSF